MKIQETETETEIKERYFFTLYLLSFLFVL